MRTPLPFALAVLACVAATAGTVTAQEPVVPPPPLPVTSPVVTVNDGPGEQNDPHVSGDLVSYTDGTIVSSQTIRYYRFSTAADLAVASPSGAHDLLADVSGDRIVFTRIQSSGNSIMVFDVAGGTTTEVAPVPESNRIGTAIGNTTVAYVEYDSTITGATFAVDLAGGGPVELSSGAGNQNPSVASNGNVVVWEQCSSSFITCDVMQAVRTGGVWGAATLVAPGAANPDTDGVFVVYDSAGDIYFKPVAGGPASQLTLADTQVNPSIRSGVIAFESNVSSPANIFVYVIATNTLYQVTSTPTFKMLNDVTVLDNGDIRVVWAANDGLALDYNIYATTFTRADAVHYEICPLYDPLVAKKKGSAYPIKVQLCDASGQNLSSESIVLHALSVTQASTNAPGPLDDTGNANPDFDFRYDASLAGYIFNLSTHGLSMGTYRLNFTVGSDPTVYSAPFAVK